MHSMVTFASSVLSTKSEILSSLLPPALVTVMDCFQDMHLKLSLMDENFLMKMGEETTPKGHLPKWIMGPL